MTTDWMDSGIEGSRVKHKPSGREGFYRGHTSGVCEPAKPIAELDGCPVFIYPSPEGRPQGLFAPDNGGIEEVSLEDLELIGTSGRPKVESAGEYRSRKTVGDANRVYNSD